MKERGPAIFIYIFSAFYWLYYTDTVKANKKAEGETWSNGSDSNPGQPLAAMQRMVTCSSN